MCSYLTLWGYVEGELEAVVGEADMLWEAGVGGFVVKLVAHVGEKGPFRLQTLHKCDGFCHVRVAGMRFRAEGVEDEKVEVLEERDGLLGDVAHVREVGGGTEAVGGGALSSVDDGDALEGCAEEGDSGGVGGLVQAVDGNAGAGGIAVFRAEGVAEDTLEGGGGVVVCVEGERDGVTKAEGAEIVHAKDVVCMVVSVEDGVEAGDALADGLGVEVGAGVNEDGVPWKLRRAAPLNADGGAGSPIF